MFDYSPAKPYWQWKSGRVHLFRFYAYCSKAFTKSRPHRTDSFRDS